MRWASAEVPSARRGRRPGPNEPVHSRHRGAPGVALAAPSLVLGPQFIVFKAHALGDLVVHRAGLIVLLRVGLLASVVRPSPRLFAGGAAGLLAFALDPRSTAVGIGPAAGMFALLLTVFVAVGTMLQRRQDDGPGRSARRARVRR